MNSTDDTLIKAIIGILLIVILSNLVSANSEEITFICGGSEQFQILCGYNLDSTYSVINETTPTNETEEEVGGGGGSTDTEPESEIEIIGEDDGSYSRINLTELIIDTSLLCIGENNLKFRTLDSNSTFTIIDTSQLKINNETQLEKVTLDLLKETYYYDLYFNETGEYNISITVNQDGKEITESRVYDIQNCANVKKTVSSWWDRFKIWYSNNKLYINIILILIAIFIVIYGFYKLLEKK